jgi:hypothetical protein
MSSVFTRALSIVARNRGHCRHPAKQRNNSRIHVPREKMACFCGSRHTRARARVSSGAKKSNDDVDRRKMQNGTKRLKKKGIVDIVEGRGGGIA